MVAALHGGGWYWGRHGMESIPYNSPFCEEKTPVTREKAVMRSSGVFFDIVPKKTVSDFGRF